jgi:hypothetical protein
MASLPVRRTITGPERTPSVSGIRAKPVTVETGRSGDRNVDDEQLATPNRTTRPASTISPGFFMAL